VFRMSKMYYGLATKIIFCAGFLLSFNFISFYSLCRGYGISMSLLILALYYFFVYMRFGAFSHFAKFILFSQLALSANLTLVFVLAITTVISVLMQLKNKVFFQKMNVLLLTVHAALVLFWVKYAFFLQSHGALYYGSGDSYWKVTFETLIETIFFKDQIINFIFIGLFLLMGIYWIFRSFTRKFEFITQSSFSISYFVLCALIVSFYLLKKVLGVNYPEDRTGLFFYVFFVISFAFMLNEATRSARLISLAFPVAYVLNFLSTFNFEVHSWRIYETMPKGFFDILVSEQEKSNRRITIGGHRVREFFYGFLNYKSSVKLNHMTAPEALQMNCDYALAYKQDKPYYDKYYEELASDNYWDFRLLKRRTMLERKLLLETERQINLKGEDEYYNVLEKLDTTFNSQNPVLAEFTFDVNNAPEPFNAWLVLQVDDATNENSSFLIRVPLNLIKYYWNSTRACTISLTSPNMPIGVKRIVAYLWNIDKKNIDVTVTSFRLYQLNGEGVKEIS
ncbi:MAG: hypothetical protein JNL60_17525, partial [Bacteroidia bacterium]|nr:hypothetical protein [Bacteroidia bacterium]